MLNEGIHSGFSITLNTGRLTGFETSPFDNYIILLGNAIIPLSVVILINLGNKTIFIDFEDHAHMTDIVLASCFDGNFAAWTHNIVGTSADPYLFQDRARWCREDGLLRY